MRKAGKAALAVVVALAAMAVVALAWVVLRPLPEFGGVRHVAGLNDTVDIAFDAKGVPHIAAHRREDAFVALGYATTRDRLFQMDLFRRKAAGRLAEVFGAALVEEDRWSRLMGFGRLADAVLLRLPQDQRSALDSYAIGVNQAMRDARAWPWEFTALRYAPESWSPRDSVLVALQLASLSYSETDERTASVMRAALRAAVVDFLTPDGDCHSETTPQARARCGASPPTQELRELYREADRTKTGRLVVARERPPQGSNGWVVGASKTDDGRAILANDMHLALDLPNIWYQADLAYGPLRVEGLTLPGLPLVISGSNGHVAWGMTSVEGDFTDLVRLRRAADADHYASPDGARAFGVRVERIGVRDGADVELRVKETIWGPVLPKLLLGDEVALHWSMLDPEATNLALINLDRARTVEEAAPVMQEAGVPPLNALLADDHGAIGWTLMGRLPKRQGTTGLFAEYWHEGVVGWDGYLPRAELPIRVNPAQGFIASANQRMLPLAEFPVVVGHDYSGAPRAARLDARLREMTRIDEQAMADLQLDTQTPLYRFYQEIALRALAGASDDKSADARRALEAWDGRAEPQSIGLPLLTTFRKLLIDATLSPLLARCRALDPTFSYSWMNADEPVRRLIESADPLLVPDKAAGGDWNSFLRGVMTASVDRLHETGLSPAARWGEANRVEIGHPLAAAAPALAYFLNMPRAAVAGCEHCVRYYAAENGASSGANARMVVAPGREGAGLIQSIAGQSGQFASPHYNDQQAQWVAGGAEPFRSSSRRERLMLAPEK